MNLSTSTPVVTGAARGLGRHLVDALLERGASKVYALARDTGRVRHDPRIVPVTFDLLDAESITASARRASDATLLINNASTAEFAGPLDGAPDAVGREMAVNYHGTFAAIRAFVPVLEANGGGHIINVLSLLSGRRRKFARDRAGVMSPRSNLYMCRVAVRIRSSSAGMSGASLRRSRRG